MEALFPTACVTDLQLPGDASASKRSRSKTLAAAEDEGSLSSLVLAGLQADDTNETARHGLGDEVRRVPRLQLVAQIFNVALDRPRRDAEFLSALLGREPSSDGLEDFSLTIAHSHELSACAPVIQALLLCAR